MHCSTVSYEALVSPKKIPLKSMVFWVITRRRMVIIYRRFGTTYRSHPHGSRFQVGKKAYNIGNAKHSGVARRVM
jgi:hypothetical protein